MSDRVPDAWDDDFEEVADTKPTATRAPQTAGKKPASRAERRAQHVEANKALWNSAENPDDFHFVDAIRRDNVPLKTEFKPAVTVLSRKPKAEPKTAAPTIASRAGVSANDIVNGLSAASLNESGASGATAEDDDPDSEEEARREQERTLKDRQEKARIEREEKQRKYNEVRSRLFGAPDAEVQSAASRAGTPSKEQSATGASSPGRTRGGARSSGRGRGGSAQSTRSSSSADQSPARQLYDPDYSAKPGSVFLANRSSQNGDASRNNSAHVRAPRGPDGSGRGGAGFSPRGRGSKVT